MSVLRMCSHGCSCPLCRRGAGANPRTAPFPTVAPSVIGSGGALSTFAELEPGSDPIPLVQKNRVQ